MLDDNPLQREEYGLLNEAELNTIFFNLQECTLHPEYRADQLKQLRHHVQKLEGYREVYLMALDCFELMQKIQQRDSEIVKRIIEEVLMRPLSKEIQQERSL